MNVGSCAFLTACCRPRYRGSGQAVWKRRTRSQVGKRARRRSGRRPRCARTTETSRCAPQETGKRRENPVLYCQKLHLPVCAARFVPAGVRNMSRRALVPPGLAAGAARRGCDWEARWASLIGLPERSRRSGLGLQRPSESHRPLADWMWESTILLVCVNLLTHDEPFVRADILLRTNNPRGGG
jgi:hypothetical protein